MKMAQATGNRLSALFSSNSPAPVLCVERASVFLREQYTCIPSPKMRSDAILRPFPK
jgi:hypothetical protein